MQSTHLSNKPLNGSALLYQYIILIQDFQLVNEVAVNADYCLLECNVM